MKSRARETVTGLLFGYVCSLVGFVLGLLS